MCDGNNSTPNLTNRFVVGSGASYSVNDTGGSANAVVVSHNHGANVNISGGGAHTHSFSDSFTASGSHSHSFSDSFSASGSHSHTFSGSNSHSHGLNLTDSAHQHTTAIPSGSQGIDTDSHGHDMSIYSGASNSSSWGATANVSGTVSSQSISISGSTSNQSVSISGSVSGNTSTESVSISGSVSGTTGSGGSGVSGTATIDSEGVTGTNKNLPPYYALCYIMKT